MQGQLFDQRRADETAADGYDDGVLSHRMALPRPGLSERQVGYDAPFRSCESRSCARGRPHRFRNATAPPMFPIATPGTRAGEPGARTRCHKRDWRPVTGAEFRAAIEFWYFPS